jgi:hypothetical protein
MASGDYMLEWGPLANEPPATLYATSTVRNNHPTLEFDAAASWGAMFSGVLPASYGGGGLTVDLIWMAASATTGNVVWGAAIERLNTDQDADSFATQLTATGAANGTSGITTKTSIAFTSGAAMDSLVAGEEFRLQIQRIGANGSDTMAGNAQLTKVALRET